MPDPTEPWDDGLPRPTAAEREGALESAGWVHHRYVDGPLRWDRWTHPDRPSLDDEGGVAIDTAERWQALPPEACEKALAVPKLEPASYDGGDPWTDDEE